MSFTPRKTLTLVFAAKGCMTATKQPPRLTCVTVPQIRSPAPSSESRRISTPPMQLYRACCRRGRSAIGAGLPVATLELGCSLGTFGWYAGASAGADRVGAFAIHPPTASAALVPPPAAAFAGSHLAGLRAGSGTPPEVFAALHTTYACLARLFVDPHHPKACFLAVALQFHNLAYPPMQRISTNLAPSRLMFTILAVC